MKDAKGHGSNAKGSHAAKIEQLSRGRTVPKYLADVTRSYFSPVRYLSGRTASNYLANVTRNYFSPVSYLIGRAKRGKVT